MHKVFIKELIINNWRNINNEIILIFNPRVNIIRGGNGVGKTSIIDAISYMLFSKNLDNQNDFNDVQYNNDGFQLKEKYPSIKINLVNGIESFWLATQDNKWYINDKEFDSRSKYLDALKIRLNIDLDELANCARPHLLLEKFNNDSNNDKRILRDYIIYAANSKSHSSELVNEINEFSNNIEIKNKIATFRKNDESTLRTISKRINEIKSLVPNIEQFQKIDSDEIKRCLSEINKKINNYSEVQDHIKHIDNKIKDINIKLNGLEQLNDKSNVSKFNWGLFLFLFILGIIPSIIYLSCYLFKHNKNANDKFLYVDGQSLKKELMNLQNERGILVVNPNYKDVNIDQLYEQKKQLESTINEEFSKTESMYLNYLDLMEQGAKLDNKIQEALKKEYEIDVKNKKIADETHKILKDIFPDLTIYLLNEKNEEDLEIRKNGVPFQYLNHSAKQNIIFQLNEIISNKNKIVPFFLIDQGESLNNIYQPKDNQVIICNVTSEPKLIFNGEELNK